MNIDFTPLYRNSVGFDRLARMLDQAMNSETSSGYPPYDIEMLEENHYDITIAVAGFDDNELDINVGNGVLTVHGKKEATDKERKFLYHGIAQREFERKFNLADHIEVHGAELKNGLLKIHLVKEIPEAMKPRKISITSAEGRTLEHHQDSDSQAA